MATALAAALAFFEDPNLEDDDIFKMRA